MKAIKSLRQSIAPVVAALILGCATVRTTLHPIAGSEAPALELAIYNNKQSGNSYLTRLIRDPVHLGVPFDGSKELASRSWNLSAELPQAQDCRGRYEPLSRSVPYPRLLLQDFTEAELDAAIGAGWRDMDESWRGWRGMVHCSDEAALYVLFFERNHWWQLLHPVRGIAKDRGGTIYRIDFYR